MRIFKSSIFAVLLCLVCIGVPLMLSQTTVNIPTVTGFTITNTAGTTNTTLINITPLNNRAAAIPGAKFNFWLSDSPSGNQITTSPTATGTAVTILGSSAMAEAITTSNQGATQTFALITGNTGVVRISVLDIAKNLYFPVAQAGNVRVVGAKLTSGSYGFLFGLPKSDVPAMFTSLYNVLFDNRKGRI